MEITAPVPGPTHLNGFESHLGFQATPNIACDFQGELGVGGE